MEFNYREELNQTFREKRLKNPNYSLRAFSRDLGVSVTALSDVLAGKRNFAKKNAEKISKKLCFSPEQRKQMLRELNGKSVSSLEPEKSIQIREDEFQLISSWYHLALLTLSQQKNVLAEPKSLASRFGVAEEKIKKALETLQRLNFVEIKKGKLVRTTLPLRTTSDVPSYAIRKYHKDNLKLIENSLDNVQIELREVSSMNLNVNPNKMKQAKEMINRFKEEFTLEMEKSSPRDVYTLAMHFFPAKLSEEVSCEN